MTRFALIVVMIIAVAASPAVGLAQTQGQQIVAGPVVLAGLEGANAHQDQQIAPADPAAARNGDVMPDQIMPRRRANQRMLNVVKRMGLASGLQLVLDAGDVDSYDGSSQIWSDVSGNGNHFYRGATSGSDGSDPTFNGVAGRQASTEYFSSDGGDGFWEASDLSFTNSWHKDGAAFTVAAWVFCAPGATVSHHLFKNFWDVTGHGASIRVAPLSSTGRVVFSYANGDGVGYSVRGPSEDVIVENAWMFVAFSFSEGSGNSFVRANGHSELTSLDGDTLTSPSASNPSGGVSIWAAPDVAGTAMDTATAENIVPSGSRLNAIMAWNRFLTQAEVTSLYDATRGKFGL